MPRGVDWKTGVCAALGIADTGEMWGRVNGAVRSFRDLETPLITARGAVDRLRHGGGPGLIADAGRRAGATATGCHVLITNRPAGPERPRRRVALWQDECMSAWIWFSGAVLLSIAEVLGAEFVLLMLGGGALVTAGVALFFPELLWLQLIVFALSSVALVLGLRPMLLRKYYQPSQDPQRDRGA